jgi:hypothetical protein
MERCKTLYELRLRSGVAAPPVLTGGARADLRDPGIGKANE